jgi:hypothetical protein
MSKIKELTEEIQRLENSYAESLAGNDDHKTLYGIWKKIKELRDQLDLHENVSTEGAKSA